MKNVWRTDELHNLGTLLLLFCLQFRVQCSWDGVCDTEVSNSSETAVFLSVSSLASHPDFSDRHLELNWYNIPTHVDEMNSSVRLYSQNPRDNMSNYLVSIEPHSHNGAGYYRTDVQFPRHNFSDENLTSNCLNFWIALVHDENIVASSCIRTFPNWMFDMRNQIGNFSLLELVIPGTHNAASYAHYDPDDDGILRRYLITQEENVWNQLVYGIRYLDLRVSYEKVNGVADRFWITHGVFRTDIPLRKVLYQVKMFLNSTHEIVIMDFHRFVNGFTGKRSSNRHRSLISFLEAELIDYMIPVSMSSWATLNELWAADRRLYVGYASNSERNKSRFLFPAVKHLWGNKDKINELFAYLNSSVCSRRQNRLSSAMAQLTPTTSGAIFDFYGGLRKMASDVNRDVTRWFRELWSHCSNIVSTDFFLGNGIIQMAIQANIHRSNSNRNSNCMNPTEGQGENSVEEQLNFF